MLWTSLFLHEMLVWRRLLFVFILYHFLYHLFYTLTYVQFVIGWRTIIDAFLSMHFSHYTLTHANIPWFTHTHSLALNLHTRSLTHTHTQAPRVRSPLRLPSALRTDEQHGAVPMRQRRDRETDIRCHYFRSMFRPLICIWYSVS